MDISNSIETRYPGRDERASRLMLMFAPLDKNALGLACGTVTGVCLALSTLILLLTYRGGPLGPNLNLLSWYFFGYSVSWRGVVVGLLWGGIVGYFTGWLFAFLRNFVLALCLLFIKTKAELQQYHSFVKHL